MPEEFVPSGYIPMREALNRVGRGLFPSDWTGNEHEARPGLISADEWSRIKDLPPARGGGAPGSGTTRRAYVPPQNPQPHSTRDPSDPSYQDEYRAREQYNFARHRLRQMLEAGELEAAILDPFSGALHRAPTSLWRRHDADRVIERGLALIPHSPNTGRLLIKQFAGPNVDIKPMPQAKIQEAIKTLKEKSATETLTRPQQKDFLRKTFPNCRITERQFTEIFRSVKVQTGRPRKSDK